jgi:hypothetical protein
MWAEHNSRTAQEWHLPFEEQDDSKRNFRSEPITAVQDSIRARECTETSDNLWIRVGSGGRAPVPFTPAAIQPPPHREPPLTPPPFIYVAALRRSGSKLVARALTNWPKSYVLLEPGLAIPTLRAKPEATALLAEFDLDLLAASESISRRPPDARPAAVVQEILAPLREVVPVVGVKEIRHQAADLALDALGADTRVVVLVRDPRGILDSLRRKEAWRTRPIELPGGLSPASLADHLREQFAAQRRMLDRRPACAIRYEDLCERPTMMAAIRRFCGLPENLDADLDRLDGHEVGARGGGIDADACDRWRSDEPHADEAAEIFDLLRDECDYWGYGARGDRTETPPGPPTHTVAVTSAG